MNQETKTCQNCPDKFSKAKSIRDPVSKFIVINFYRDKWDYE